MSQDNAKYSVTRRNAIKMSGSGVAALTSLGFIGRASADVKKYTFTAEYNSVDFEVELSDGSTVRATDWQGEKSITRDSHVYFVRAEVSEGDTVSDKYEGHELAARREDDNWEDEDDRHFVMTAEGPETDKYADTRQNSWYFAPYNDDASSDGTLETPNIPGVGDKCADAMVKGDVKRGQKDGFTVSGYVGSFSLTVPNIQDDVPNITAVMEDKEKY